MVRSTYTSHAMPSHVLRLFQYCFGIFVMQSGGGCRNEFGMTGAEGWKNAYRTESRRWINAKRPLLEPLISCRFAGQKLNCGRRPFARHPRAAAPAKQR